MEKRELDIDFAFLRNQRIIFSIAKIDIQITSRIYFQRYKNRETKILYEKIALWKLYIKSYYKLLANLEIIFGPR